MSMEFKISIQLYFLHLTSSLLIPKQNRVFAFTLWQISIQLTGIRGRNSSNINIGIMYVSNHQQTDRAKKFYNSYRLRSESIEKKMNNFSKYFAFFNEHWDIPVTEVIVGLIDF